MSGLLKNLQFEILRNMIFLYPFLGNLVKKMLVVLNMVKGTKKSFCCTFEVRFLLEIIFAYHTAEEKTSKLRKGVRRMKGLDIQ